MKGSVQDETALYSFRKQWCETMDHIRIKGPCFLVQTQVTLSALFLVCIMLWVQLGQKQG